jgi:fluoride exporter
MTGLLVALGAAVGAPLRFLLGHYLDEASFPRGTLVANVVGSLLLVGFSALSLSGSELALFGTGFCGGLTTYSAFSVKAYELGWRRGAAYATLTILGSLVACAAGFGLVEATYA